MALVLMSIRRGMMVSVVFIDDRTNPYPVRSHAKLTMSSATRRLACGLKRHLLRHTCDKTVYLFHNTLNIYFGFAFGSGARLVWRFASVRLRMST